jgi:hypothetical protein
MSTATLKKIDAKLKDLPPDSLRHKTLAALRRFRASWVELGKLLTEVAYGGDYKEWGYEEFEVYCAQELGLKKPTVKKLMVSYNYMKRYEPRRLDAFEEDAGVAESIPDYQTVELLQRARENTDLEEKEQHRLHSLVFSEESGEEGAVRKEIRTHLRPASDEEIGDRNSSRRHEIEDILRTARALRRKLEASRAVPAGLKGRLDEILTELEAID